MKWSFLETIFVGITLLSVVNALVENLNDELDYDPQVAVTCDKPTRHVDVNNGDWVTDKNSTRLCTTDKNEILKYCKAVYPSQDVRNVVEANNRVLVGDSLVTPYRCLVGDFESDALLVPPKCRFEHMHFTSDCLSHDEWHKKASDKCQSESMVVKDYGVLIPCSVGKFTGVEFVCCPADAMEEATDAVKIVPVTEAAKPISVLEHLKNEISKFAKHVEGASVGCDRSEYRNRKDKLEQTHTARVQSLIGRWEKAEKRYKLLKTADKEQADSAIAQELENFKNSLNSYDEEAKRERHQLKEEHHQCTQIDLNDKKNRALQDFVAALQEEPRDGNKILEAVQRFVKTCTQDRLHNLRYFEYVQKHSPEKADEARESLQNHFKGINKLVNESMILLYKLPEIARQFQFDLPDWIPKPPALPTTEAPTVEKSSAAKDPTDPPSHPEGKSAVTGTPARDEPKGAAARKGDDDNGEDDEDESEDEEATYLKSHSRTTFSAVIGLSCGALVIMIIIVVAMAMRRPRSNHNTKTVLVDTDTEGTSEKSHLMNMQENGYENPTYKFYDY